MKADEILTRFGREDILDLVRQSGRTVKGNNRCQCPLDGCQDQRDEAKTNATVFQSHTHFVLHCHRCNQTADYIALYRMLHRCSFEDAVAQLSGVEPKPVVPKLRLLKQAVVVEEGKISSDQVRTLWTKALVGSDSVGETYLESRGLKEAADLGYVRFATETCEERNIRFTGSKGYRIGLLLADLAGQPKGIQFRFAGNTDDKLRSLRGGSVKACYFGRPAEVLKSHTVVVTEGMADTLAALLWTKGQEGLAVVGVPGIGQLRGLAEALKQFNIDCEGRTFVLLAQHDQGKRGNASLAQFMGLKTALLELGANAFIQNEPPGGTKDWAESYAQHVLGEWPPESIRKLVSASDEAPASMRRKEDLAVWVPATTEEPRALAKNLSTLRFLLSNERYRRGAIGPGEWALNEMTGRVEYGGRPLTDIDVTNVRTQLEMYEDTKTGKPLTFSAEDVINASTALASLNSYHPVRKYLSSVTWDSVDRLDALGTAMGLKSEESGLEIEYLRLWMMSAVARVFEPGAKADLVLVLKGPQGVRKSSFFSALGGQWTIATSAEMGSVDLIEALRGAWLVELDEMDAILRSREQAQVKAFLTRPEDTYRPKYARTSVTVKRTSVFAGTTNDEAVIADVTGGRRYCVVETLHSIDLDWVKGHRDQLWAQAVQMYQREKKWWLDDDRVGVQAAANELHSAGDPWQEHLIGWMNDKLAVEQDSSANILEEVLKVPRFQQTSSHSRRLANLMRSLGWTKVKSHGLMVWRRGAPDPITALLPF